MRLYHGSSKQFDVIERRQATKSHDDAPPTETLNAIYVTPDLGFAIAMAARPEGRTHIEDREKTIHFENPHFFDPDMLIYVYEVNVEEIAEDKVLPIDHLQAALDVDAVTPVAVQKYKAHEVLKYYTPLNWPTN
jgi:hypothetical protein